MNNNIEEFSSIVDSFKTESFRLESLDEYNVGVDDEMREAFLRGEPFPRVPRQTKDWYEGIRKKTDAGALIHRVRTVGKTLTPYIQYELWMYPLSIEAGEVVQLAPAHVLERCGEIYDFYQIDNQYIRMFYGDKAEFVGFEIIENVSEIERLKQIKETAIEASITLQDWLSSERRMSYLDRTLSKGRDALSRV